MLVVGASRHSRVPRSRRVEIPEEISEPSLKEYWLEKYLFCLSKLHLNEESASAWASRAVRVKQEVAAIELRAAR